MLDFINKLFSSGFMSIFFATLLATMGILEYLVSGRQKRVQFEEQIDALKNKDIKETMLDQIAFLKSYTQQFKKHLKLEESFEKRIDKLENEIKLAGPITIRKPHFWEEKSEEVQKLFDYVDTKMQNSKKRIRQKSLFLYSFVSSSIYVYIGISLHIISFDLSNLAVWISFGIITVLLICIFFYFYTRLYILTITKMSPLLIYVSKSSQFSTAYGITKLFLYGCIIVSYIFFSSVYKYIYPSAFPMLSNFANSLITIIIIVTEIVSAIGGYLQLYEFAEKRFFKRENSDKDY